MIDAEREALIEKMARAIACHDAPNPKDCLASEWCEENWICYRPEATAAFAVAEAADCIDTIRTENEKLRSANNDLREALAYEQKAATAEIEKLRAALKPFALSEHKIERWFGMDIPDSYSVVSQWVTVGDLRAAAAALKETGDE